MLDRRINLPPAVIAELNIVCEFVRQAAVVILQEPPERIPLVVFDNNIDVSLGETVVEGVVTETPFGVAKTPKIIHVHPRDAVELIHHFISLLPGGLEGMATELGVSPKEVFARTMSFAILDLAARQSVKPLLQERNDQEAILTEIKKQASTQAIANGKFGEAL